MGQIPWYLKFLSILMSWINYYSVKTHCLRCPSPLHCPSLNYIGLGQFMYFDQQNVNTNDLLFQAEALWVMKCFHLPLWELPTMPWQEQALGKHWSKKKEKHEEQTWRHTAAWSRAIPASQQTYEQLTNAYCYMLPIFCGWFLCSVTISIAN